MKTCYRLFLAGLILLAAAPLSAAEKKPLTADAARRLFVERVRLLLKQKCLGCHGEGKELEGEFRLSQELSSQPMIAS